MKTFKIVTTAALVIAGISIVLGCIGLFPSGFYPGFIFLVINSSIPVLSKVYAVKAKRANDKRTYYTLLTIVNVLSIFIALWLTFVITHDRILGDC